MINGSGQRTREFLYEKMKVGIGQRISQNEIIAAIQCVGKSQGNPHCAMELEKGNWNPHSTMGVGKGHQNPCAAMTKPWELTGNFPKLRWK